MTIKVTVTNDDERDTEIITVHTVNRKGETISFGPASVNLATGESAEFYVHSNQSLIVEEKIN